MPGLFPISIIQESKIALQLKARIEATDKEIDRMVYKFYGLTEELQKSSA